MECRGRETDEKEVRAMESEKRAEKDEKEVRAMESEKRAEKVEGRG